MKISSWHFLTCNKIKHVLKKHSNKLIIWSIYIYNLQSICLYAKLQRAICIQTADTGFLKIIKTLNIHITYLVCFTFIFCENYQLLIIIHNNTFINSTFNITTYYILFYVPTWKKHHTKFKCLDILLQTKACINRNNCKTHPRLFKHSVPVLRIGRLLNRYKVF